MVLLCVYWPTIFILSHIPKQSVPKGWTVSGAPIHFLAYFGLTLLVFAAAGLVRRTYLRCRKTWLLVGLVGCYGGLDEILQVFIDGRRGSFEDWLVDVVACLLCVGLLWLVTLGSNRKT